MIAEKEIKLVTGLMPFWSDNPTVLDAGSNKGGWCDVILDRFKENCDIHLFEPNLMLLNYTKIKFDYKKNISYNHVAAFSKDNLVKPFYYFENFNNGLSSLYKQDWWEKELPMQVMDINTIQLDTYCQKLGIKEIDCIKIDCEGGDVDVLHGCETLLAQGAVKFLIIEYGSHYRFADKLFKDVINWVNNFGYTVYSFNGSNYIQVNSKDFIEDYHAEDYIITKKKISNVSEVWNKEFVKNTSHLGKLNMVLEIGAFEGFTSKYICENLVEEGGRFLVVDPLLDVYYEGDSEHDEMFEGQYGRFLRNTYNLPLELIRDKSQNVLPLLHELRFDLIYIDGDHRRIFEDAELCMKILKVGGLLIIDDYLWRDYTIEDTNRFLEAYNGNINILFKGYQVGVVKTIDF